MNRALGMFQVLCLKLSGLDLDIPPLPPPTHTSETGKKSLYFFIGSTWSDAKRMGTELRKTEQEIAGLQARVSRSVTYQNVCQHMKAIFSGILANVTNI